MTRRYQDSMSMPSSSEMLISIVVPAFNEQDVLQEFHRRLREEIDPLPYNFEIIYINDGSIDDTLSIIQTLRESDSRIAVIDLSRNFGKEIALIAGFDHVHGQAAISIDADLQHPPQLIPEMVEKWQEGFDIVYAVRDSREDEGFLKRIMANIFYRIFSLVGRSGVSNSSDYRLFSRRALDALIKLREQHRFMKGLSSWIGFSQISISYQPDQRYAGSTKWSFYALWNLSLEAITSSTIIPLKLASFIGLLTAVAAIVYAVIVVLKKIIFGDPVPGYPSLMVIILFLGAVQLITIGILGEYLGRVFDETKERPLYFLKSYDPPNNMIDSDPDNSS